MEKRASASRRLIAWIAGSLVSSPCLKFGRGEPERQHRGGERDEQHEFGLTIPLAGWTFDVSNFRTGAKNFFDHDVLGNSNIFFPLTIARARIRGWEGTATSPRIAGRAQFHAAYSHQYAEGAGGVTGGLTDFEPPDEGYFFLDHDQRSYRMIARVFAGQSEGLTRDDVLEELAGMGIATT